ncbi:MAG: hypothetical protein JW947_07315 [Sedimentisphaerales bacterium]|nr:hypothetical protein [Sedimentisphaerales bacterium]
MNIEAFLLCDAATDQQGKLNVLGAFDTIWAKNVPTMHPACAIAVRIRFEKIEEGSHPIRIHIIDEDGKPIGPKLEGNVNVRVGDDVDSGIANIVLNIQRLKLEKYGQYRIDIAIDNQMKGSLPFHVREIPTQTK